MTKFFTIVAYFLALGLGAQTQIDFENQMATALSHANLEEKTIQLKIISTNFENEWLADYYLAKSVIDKSYAYLGDKDKLEENLKLAQSYLDKMYKIENDEVELLLLQANLYMIYVASNPDIYGRKYAGIMTNIYNKAYKLSPENPRVVLKKAVWEMGSAKYFGNSTAKYCLEFDKAVQLFESYKLPSKIYPNWGLAEAENASKTCK